MKKFLDFTGTDITKKRVNRVILPKTAILVPISVFRQIRSQKSDFWAGKTQLFTKQAVSSKKNQFWFISAQKIELLQLDSSSLCTISGGQDSILTFFLLLHTKKFDSLKILYCQHLWQIKNFFSARLIFQISYLVKVPYTLILPQKFFNTENESRNWRKKVFCRFSKLEKIITTITGHSETDNLEKNLNNLFRGTSPAGLSSLKILTCPNKVGLFFSTIDFTSYFFPKSKKTTKCCQKFLFQNNLKIKAPINAVCNQKQRLGSNQRAKFQFFKQLSPFLHFHAVPLNLVKQQKPRAYQSYGISKKFLSTPVVCHPDPYSYPKFVKLDKKISTNFDSSLNSFKSFSFFDSTTIFPTNQTIQFSKQKKSYSFCFSNQFLKLQGNLFKPLEKMNRFSISKIVNLYNFPLLIDVTNFSYLFSRNKIRHQLIPFIRSLIHLNVESLLIHFFKLITQEHQNTEKEVQELEFLCKNLILNLLKKRTEFFFSSTSRQTGTKNFVFGKFLCNTKANTKPLSRSTQEEKTPINRNLITHFDLKHTGLTNNLGECLVKMLIIPNLKLKNELLIEEVKILIKKTPEFQIQDLFQKNFFHYKNINLSYFQILNLQHLYSGPKNFTKNKVF